MSEEYARLQAEFAEANGRPADAVMARLKAVGARLGELRHAASMGAFRDAERGDRGGTEDQQVAAAIAAADHAAGAGPVAFSGLGF